MQPWQSAHRAAQQSHQAAHQAAQRAAQQARSAQDANLAAQQATRHSQWSADQARRLHTSGIRPHQGRGVVSGFFRLVMTLVWVGALAAIAIFAVRQLTDW